jgi:DNA-binding response OmpR family regulator
MTRVLFVDDEPGIRETLPEILRNHGFEVSVAATVPEALAFISGQSFDVLITDLNIGSAGDGFTVVSAMRRTHPDCVTFILTGFPGLDTALQAIRSQVDDYLIKPAHPRKLIEMIEGKLRQPSPHNVVLTQRLSAILREHADNVLDRTLALMKAHPEVKQLALSDGERISIYPGMIRELADMLDSPESVDAITGLDDIAIMRGRLRREQGYTIPLLIVNLRLLESAIYDVVNENMLALNLSFLMADLKKLNEILTLMLERTVKAYQRMERHAA